jgi:hypothetical protein
MRDIWKEKQTAAFTWLYSANEKDMGHHSCPCSHLSHLKRKQPP